MTKTNPALADLGHAAQRRAVLYHVLLRRAIKDYAVRDMHYPGAGCFFCGAMWITDSDERHADDCLRALILRALDPNATPDTIRALLAEHATVSED
jgi:hypothetical protein